MSGSERVFFLMTLHVTFYNQKTTCLQSGMFPCNWMSYLYSNWMSKVWLTSPIAPQKKKHPQNTLKRSDDQNPT
jgi:hypothetical protein